MTYVNDPSPSDWSQVQEDYHCPRCDHFGTVRGHDYYGIIYGCDCLPVFWAIDPKTGEKVEFC